MSKVYRILQKLEVEQLPQEPRPVGGYGAGITALLENGDILTKKVGKINKSPAALLSEIVDVTGASVLLGHVRMPSTEFMKTAKFKETAQPYVVELDPKLTVASVHNGKMENYEEIRRELGPEHVFESEKYQLIDSEVVPHFFEKTLNEKGSVTDALYAFFCALKGSNAVAILQIGEVDSFLHLIHKGKTRGLTVWTNGKKEVVFCSRKKMVMEELGEMLAKRKFTEKVLIPYHEDAGLILSYLIPPR